MNPALATKAQWRAHIRATRAQRARASHDAIAELGCALAAQVDRVGLYVSYGDELPTDALFTALTATIYVPSGDGWARLTHQPVDDAARRNLARAGLPDWGNSDLLLIFVPALAIDRAGYRLGQGGGWYDRALAAQPQARLIGCVWAADVVAALPHEDHDIPVDLILTESGVIVPNRR